MNTLATSGYKMFFGKEQVHFCPGRSGNVDQQRTIGEVYQQIVDITEIIENIRLLRIKVRISHTLPKYSATEVPTISVCILRKLSDIV